MEDVKKFILITKEKKKLSVYEPEKIKYYELKPNNSFQFGNMIAVDKMLVTEKNLIKNIIDRKCQKSLEKILKLLAIIYEDDELDSDGTGILELALNQVEKFRQLIATEYEDYMTEKDLSLLLKKLEILESEMKLRLETIENFKNGVFPKIEMPEAPVMAPLIYSFDDDEIEGGSAQGLGTIESAKAEEQEAQKSSKR